MWRLLQHIQRLQGNLSLFFLWLYNMYTSWNFMLVRFSALDRSTIITEIVRGSHQCVVLGILGYHLISVCCVISYQCVLLCHIVSVCVVVLCLIIACCSYILSVYVVLYLISVCCIKLLQMQRLPCLPSSNILLDTLTGRDEMIGFEDVLNGETKTVHACMCAHAHAHTHTHTSMHSWQTNSKPLHTFVGQVE